MSREVCEHGVDINGIITCLDCEHEFLTEHRSTSSRENFEDYFAATRKKRKELDFTQRADGTYAHDHVQRHWHTWQIARGERTYER